MGKTILMLNHYAAQPKYSGGRRYHDWAKYLKDKGYDVYIICSGTIHRSNIKILKDSEKYKIVEDEGIKYTYVKTGLYSGNGLQRIKNMFDYYFATKKVVKILPKPTAIIARSPNPLACVAGIQIAKKSHSAVISDIVDLWPESIVTYQKISKQNLIIKIMYMGEKWIYKHTDSIIFSMEGGYSYIQEKNWQSIIPSDKVFHVNMGVDIKQFDENAGKYQIDEENLVDTNTFKVSYCGAVSLVNNLKLVCDAGKILLDQGHNDISIMVHGSGNQVDALKEYCDENKITNVKIYGYIEKKHIPFVLTHSDLCILCYQNTPLLRFGGSMNKMFEYFASGRPVISNSKMGFSLIQKYNCGTELDTNDPVTLAASILSYKEMDYKKRTEIGNNSRKAAEDYDIHKMCQQMEKAILYAIHQKKKGIRK